MPRTPGHTLVIPKAPARNLLDISADDFAHVARATRLIARAAMPAFNAHGMSAEELARRRREFDAQKQAARSVRESAA